MSYLVDECILDSGDKVIIRWSDGSETRAVYKETYGYNHFFDAIPKGDQEIRLSNHFMRLKGIHIRKDEE
ncbi:MAG: hypothetical protein J6Q89_06600 [Clostridia bacterium]|nr:hypothetical protein [Clostridia bacterium]